MKARQDQLSIVYSSGMLAFQLLRQSRACSAVALFRRLACSPGQVQPAGRKVLGALQPARDEGIISRLPSPLHILIYQFRERT